MMWPIIIFITIIANILIKRTWIAGLTSAVSATIINLLLIMLFNNQLLVLKLEYFRYLLLTFCASFVISLITSFLYKRILFITKKDN